MADEEGNKSLLGNEKSEIEAAAVPEEPKPAPAKASGGGGGGWGGWGFLSDLQKAAEEISRNAAAVAQTAAKSIADLQPREDAESSKEDEEKEEPVVKEKDDETDTLRKTALDKLEKASEDSFLGQGLKVLDSSVENLASGAWQALGTAWKGGSDLVHKLEQNLTESIQHGNLPVAAGSVAPSFIETGKAFTAKGMHVLELVGKETMDLLIAETGLQLDNENSKKGDSQADEDQLFEEVTFDRCFYIYGGPEQLEELEALSNHYGLLFNRRKAKLSSEQKVAYDGKLREIQRMFSLEADSQGNSTVADKGKKVETDADGCSDEMKSLHDSSVSKAADMAAGFTNALAGQAVSDMIQRTGGRLESLHSEGVHRLSEMCCFTVAQLLMLGKSIISNGNKVQEADADEDELKVDWPEDSIEKAKIIRAKAQSMTLIVEAVSNSFMTGIADVAEAFQAAIRDTIADSQEVSSQKSVQEKANSFSKHLEADQMTAVGKIQDGLQYLSYVVITASMAA